MITARCRKLLWGRSGSLCAMCRHQLIMEGTPVDDESIVGDECHIVSALPGGPRYDPDFNQGQVDDYSNLLLLCRVHHKLIDDQEMTYTAALLRNLKANHETWVSEQLVSSDTHTRSVQIHQVPENIPAFLQHIRSGKEMLAIVTDACAYAPEYDDLQNETDHELVAGFLQNVRDWGELGLDEVGDKMRAVRSLDEHIRELERSGFWVFACREQQVIEGGFDPASGWPIAHIQVLRDSNSEIISMSDREKHSGRDVQRGVPADTESGAAELHG